MVEVVRDDHQVMYYHLEPSHFYCSYELEKFSHSQLGYLECVPLDPQLFGVLIGNPFSMKFTSRDSISNAVSSGCSPINTCLLEWSRYLRRYTFFHLGSHIYEKNHGQTSSCPMAPSYSSWVSLLSKIHTE